MQNLEVVLQSLIEYKDILEKQRQSYYEKIKLNIDEQEKIEEEIAVLQRELGIYSTTE